MSSASQVTTASGVPEILKQGFRPFFLAAGVWACIAVALWIGMFAAGWSMPSRFEPLAWHIHEMLFGFLMAAVAGFLLTAIPNWTGRLPLRGIPLALLAALWLLGRIACLVSALLPQWLAIVADLAFQAALIAVVAREIVAGRNWRNLMMLLPVTVLGVANLLMHLEATGIALPPGIGWRLGLAAMVVLVSVVAGRIIPSFTRNWLVKRGAASLPSPMGLPDRLALATLHAGTFAWVFLPSSRAVGALLLAACCCNLWRLARWRGLATLPEPLLLILHVGYAWLAAASGLLGLSLLAPGVPLSAGIHTLTVGAFGAMTLAVMTRATRGHTGQALTADWATRLVYLAVTAAALARIAAAFAPAWTPAWAMPLLIASGCLWIAAFGGFLLRYSPMLRGRA